jgi:uncharacterized membrane-anchored protein YitT (DUF2179 family)
MYYTIFIVSIIMVFVNLPWALNGIKANIVAMIICGLLAAIHLALAARHTPEK